MRNATRGQTLFARNHFVHLPCTRGHRLAFTKRPPSTRAWRIRSCAGYFDTFVDGSLACFEVQRKSSLSSSRCRASPSRAVVATQTSTVRAAQTRARGSLFDPCFIAIGLRGVFRMYVIEFGLKWWSSNDTRVFRPLCCVNP